MGRREKYSFAVIWVGYFVGPKFAHPVKLYIDLSFGVPSLRIPWSFIKITY